jgi:hypothetical protein
VTRDGTLIFARGENGRRTSLVWLDARGKVDTLTAFGREDFGALDLSPDGSRLIMRSCAQAGCGIQILSLREGVRVPFSSRGISRDASWATFGWDGSQRVFASGRQTGRLRRRGRGEVSNAFSPDVDAAPDSLLGVTVLDVARDGAVLFLRDSALHVAGSWAAVRDDTLPSGIRIAEDAPWGFQLRAGGDWVAYTARSEQAGQYVVYMARTRPPYERWRASPRGGEEPVWDREGNLVYREGNRWMRVAPPTTVGQRPGVATMLFEGQYLNVLGRSHDIAPDGRHLLIAGPHDTTTTSLTVVTRWAQRLPAGGLARK